MIYSDDGSRSGNRTRLFRETGDGFIDWIYAVDFAGPYPRWYGFGGRDSITAMRARGMVLVPWVEPEVA